MEPTDEKKIESLQRQVQHYRARLREVVDEYEAKMLNLKLQAEDIIEELQDGHSHDVDLVPDAPEDDVSENE